MAKIPDIFADVKRRAQGFINNWTGVYEGKIPKAVANSESKGADEVASFVQGLFDDARDYWETEFERTKSYRYNIGKAGTYWDQNQLIEGGAHWQVWGRRNENEPSPWKQELVDPVTSYNMRAAIAYLTANWHDVSISPNIADIDPIFMQERKATDWGKRAKQVAKYMKIFGEAWVISYLDKDYAGGIATEKLCRPGSVLLTPYATGKEIEDGCWYAVHVEMVSGQYVQGDPAFKGFDIKGAVATDSDPLKYATSENPKTHGGYTFTKMYDKVEIFMDDPRLVEVPFDQEEFDQRAGKLAMTLQGIGDKPLPGEEPSPEIEADTVRPEVTDNHPRWIKAWYDFIEERAQIAQKASEEGRTTEEDEGLLQNLANLVYEQIDEHKKMGEGLPKQGAARMMYPNGRHIIKIGGKVAFDKPLEYDFPWRKLLHKVYNEEVPLRLDGRSDVEIQRPTQIAIDMMLSRFADHMFLNGNKKPWFPFEMKAEIEKMGITTNPTEPGFSQDGRPPQYGEVSEPTGYLKIMEVLKVVADKNTGVSQTVFSQASPGDSGDKVDTLLGQSEFIITGEANTNLADFVEEVVETRLLMWRQFYTTPRPYTIGGVQKLVIVADRLKNVPVVNDLTGETETYAYPQFEISVRPDSNFPNRWQRELGQLTNLLKMMPPEMQPGFAQMILDLLSERYPELGPNGKFRVINKATQIGMQVLQQQQAAEEQMQGKEDALRTAVEKRKTANLADYMAKAGITPPAGNGNGAMAPMAQ